MNMHEAEAEAAARIANEQLAAFPQGARVSLKSPTFVLVGPRFKVRWTAYPRMPEGETSESGWLSYHELTALPQAEQAT